MVSSCKIAKRWLLDSVRKYLISNSTKYKGLELRNSIQCPIQWDGKRLVLGLK